MCKAPELDLAKTHGSNAIACTRLPTHLRILKRDSLPDDLRSESTVFKSGLAYLSL